MERSLSILLLALLLASAASPAPAAAQSPAPCATAAAAALSAVGSPYVWGAKGPTSFDCSGLVYWSWLQAGYNVGLSTSDQARAGVQISCGLGDLAGAATRCWQAGDIILLRYTGGQHVSIYIGDGLFADAYNGPTGVIIHDVAADSYYWDHYWQSRRIVSCDGVSIDPGNPSLPTSVPGLEDFPDLLATVSFAVPQCGACNPDGSTIMPAAEWDGHWPSNPAEWANVGQVFQTTIGWLAWRISDMLRLLICWLLSMLAMLAAFLARIANVVVHGINGLWRLLLLFWFSLQAWFTALHYLLLDQLAALAGLYAVVAEFLSTLGLILMIGLEMLGRVILMLGILVNSVLSVFGWLISLVFVLVSAILLAIVGTDVPHQLNDNYVIYQLLRGMLAGWRDSEWGWSLVLIWTLAYVWFVFWLSQFYSGGNGAGESD